MKPTRIGNIPSRSLPAPRALSSILPFVAAVALWALPGSTLADSIGVNFGNGSRTLVPADSAGVAPFAQTNWNNVSAATAFSLFDNTGTVTAAGVSLSAPSRGDFGGTGGPDELLMSEIAFSAGGSISFTISDIPYASYDLIVYSQSTGSGDTQAMWTATQARHLPLRKQRAQIRVRPHLSATMWFSRT